MKINDQIAGHRINLGGISTAYLRYGRYASFIFNRTKYDLIRLFADQSHFRGSSESENKKYGPMANLR
jgi:hypothetical protein